MRLLSISLMRDQKNKLKSTAIKICQAWHCEYETSAGYTEGIKKSQKYCSVILLTKFTALLNCKTILSTLIKSNHGNFYIRAYYLPGKCLQSV